MVWLQYAYFFCRWLPPGHRFRLNPDFGPKRDTGPPAARKHAECVAQGKASDNYTGPDTQHVRSASGINTACALSFLNLFDIVWDICPDMMHIIKNFFEKLTFKLFSGSRVPKWSHAKNKPPRKDDPDYASKQKHHLDARARWEKAVEQNKKCIFSAADQELVDRRVKHLVGPANWIKNSMVHIPPPF